MSVIARFSGFLIKQTHGGCHVILKKWRIGVERHLAVVSAHAG